MKHFGDITKISGYDLPEVDIITGGSPCQDLSVAGKRAGLAGERSGLFMEQIRIVKEMRERDRESGRTAWAIRPRYMVWENVPGAFSSNGGKDFQAVLEEIVGIVEDDVPDLSGAVQGRWTKAGCLFDEMGAWSIAWRVHDAQFWGVPQRRKRIALVADFGGLSAPEILFERKGLSGDFEPGGAPWQGTAAGAESGAGGTVAWTYRGRESGCNVEMQNDMGNTLGARDYKQPQSVYSLQGAGETSNGSQGGDGYRKDVCYTLNAYDIHGIATSEPIMLQNNQNNAMIAQDGISYTLPASAGMGGGWIPMVAHALSARYDGSPQPDKGNGANVVCVGNGQLNQMSMAEQANTLDTMHDQQALLCASVVRRLTPLECERLQGYPDHWTDIGEWTDSKGKKHKDADSPRYKALGNSIALPFWAWLARRICAQYERPMTMASLFDGIGGFPLVFSRAGAVPVWASEIEEFPIAVTKRHFPEVETHEA